jgi:hypothetical protein
VISLLKRYGICFATLLFAACGEDEYVYPDLITQMVCLKTNANGTGTAFITDAGTIWHLQEGNRPNKLTPDSTYRVVSRYAPINDTDAQAYSFHQTISSLPKPEHEYPTIHTDPVSIQSIWQSGDYLNLVLQIMVKDQEHHLAFIDNGITLNADGTQTLTLTLYHDRKNDVEGFDEKVYLSVPLWHYKEKLNEGDTIVFQLNTYKEGITSRTFIY